MRRNYERFTAQLAALEVDGGLLYAQKANKSLALLRELAFAGCGMNNASLAEVQRALANGCPAELVEAGGPKSAAYIALACQAGTIVNVDSFAELQQVQALSQRLGICTRILLRMSGFRTAGVQILSKPTRFGIDVDTSHETLRFLCDHRSQLDFVGLSYHLDTVAISEKVVALDGLIGLSLDAMRMGLPVRWLDIGGGFKVNYLQHQDQWEAYMTALREALLGRSPAVTWQGTGFGLRAEDGVIRGNLNMYSYYDFPVQEHYLKELLAQTSNEAGMTFEQFFKETRIRLVLEPGRALLAGAGMTLARVEELRRGPAGELLIRLDMNRADITIQDLELFVDPLIIPSPAAGEAREPQPMHEGCYLIGNLCLESDFISRRKVFLAQQPQVGDLLAFANSAGYIMDFNAHRAALQPIAEKIAVFMDAAGRLQWVHDEAYWPTLSL